MSSGAPALASIRQAMARGEYLLAFDEASAALEATPDHVELRWLAVLALARAGATDRAATLLASSDLEAAVAGAPPALQEDVAALGARLAKDRALAGRGAVRRSRAREAAERYEAIYRRLGRSYTCINAATMWLAGGDPDRSAALAEDARRLAPQDGGDPYWIAATEAEAALLLRDGPAATAALTRAAAAATDLAAQASTRRQLELVCDLQGLDPDVLAPLAAPAVIHFGGHMISRRFPAEAEPVVAAAIAGHLDALGVGFGFGSLACGADVLFAEALLARSAELHVVLPFDVDEFRRVSVARGGDAWLTRFDQCLAGATTITSSTTGRFLGDDSLFDYCSRVAMGHALIRAAFLAAPVEQVVVWDGEPPTGEAGTAVDVATWRRHGRHTTVIPVGDGVRGGDAGTARSSPRSVHAMLFADVKGFSRLPDAQMGVFLEAVMTPLARTLERFDDDILFRNSWGDGLYVVLRDVTAAASCALALQDTMRELDPTAVGLPATLGLRIGAHVGPVFEAVDPVRRERNYYGVEVTRTARIEPRTPEGDVYVTDPFAALIALEAPQDLSCQYVGHIPTAKDYGTFPMYVLKRRGVASTQVEGGRTYDAFISYSHAADGQLAPALQATLQRYAKPWYRRRALRVFRDDTGLSANPHLWTSIVEALDGARWFILLSSPDAARSEWVGREITHWVEHQGPDRILPVVTDGTWSWDGATGDLDRSSTAAHPALFGVFDEEPRHVDLTWARSEVQVDPRDGRFLDAVAELAAPLRGVPKDELAGEEVRQHRRTIRTAWAAATTLAVLLVVALVAGALAFVQRDEARDQRSRAEEQTVVATARSLSAQAIAQAPLRVDVSLLLGVEGVDRERSPETTAGLLTGLNGAARLVGFHPQFDEGVAALALSPDGDAVAAADADGRVRLLDSRSWRTTADVQIDDLGTLRGLRPVDGGFAVSGTRGARVLSLPDLAPGDVVAPEGAGPEDLATVAVAPDGRRAAVAASPGATVELRDLTSGTTTARVAVPCTTVTALEWAPAGDVVAASCEDVGLALIDPAAAAVVGRTGSTGGSALAFSPDGDQVAVVGAEAVTVVDRATLTPVVDGIAVQRPRTARFSDDGGELAVGGEGRVLVWDLEADRRVDELIGVDEGVIGLVGLPGGSLLVGTRSTVSEWRLGQVPPLATGVGDGTDVLAVDGQGTRYGPRPDAPGLRVTADGDDTTDVDLPGTACAANPAPDGSAVVVSWISPGSGRAVTELRGLPGGQVRASLSDQLGLTTCVAGDTAFSADGRQVAAVADDGAAAVWDTARGGVVADGRTEAGVTGLGWSGDGQVLVTGGSTGRLRAWDPRSLEESASITLAEGSSISGVTPVAGEDRVVATVASGEVAVVDLGDEDTVGKPFRWGGTDLRSGTLSPDGRTLAALGVNGNLRLWDAPSHTVLGPGLRAFPRGDSARLVFTGDDELVTWDGVGAALGWRVDVDAWAETACDLAGRPLTADEWDQYVPGEPYHPACDGTSA